MESHTTNALSRLNSSRGIDCSQAAFKKLLRPLENGPFRSLCVSAQSLCRAQILILKIFSIFLRLKLSLSLILDKIEQFLEDLNMKSPRILLLSRYGCPWIEEGLFSAGVPIVVDYDDAISHWYEVQRFPGVCRRPLLLGQCI